MLFPWLSWGMINLKISPKAKVIRLPEVVGKGYKTFWNFKGRYRVCKGSRASKKSKTTALNIIKRMMQYPEANTLVVRKVFRTLKDSCFTELKWAINRLGVQAYWEIKESPLEMTYTPTGQKIYFRGLDDPLKVTSITVEIGYLCWCWIEEAYEITNEDDFNMLDESIRGAIPEETGLFKQITLTFNPWNEKHWIRKRFFGEITGKDAQGNPTYQFHDSWTSPDGQIYATTTNYLCNEWLDEADLKVFQTMKETNPRRYKVAGLGGWGIVDGLIYENWREELFNPAEISAKAGVKSAFGLDFGYTNDPTALFCGLVSKEEKTIWVFDELYEKALTNRAICDRVTTMGYAKERIKADCAEPKSIDELREAGLHRIRAARKGKDSVNNGIQYIQDYMFNRSDPAKYSGWFSSSHAKLSSFFQKANTDIADDIDSLFEAFDKECKRITAEINAELRTATSALTDQYYARSISYSDYKKAFNKLKREASEQIDYQCRNAMGGGISSLEDIYDALSGGSARDAGLVRYGHGSKYYRDIGKRAEETLANYGALSVVRPDLIEMLRKDKPELVEALEEVIQDMLKKAGG